MRRTIVAPMPGSTNAIADLPLRNLIPDRSDMADDLMARNNGASDVSLEETLRRC